MMDFATNAMLPALQTIWMDCFGDDKMYTDFLFERLLRPQHILVYTDGEGKPMSMLCLEPFTLASRSGKAEGSYIFGVATGPEYQGRGLSTALLDECHRRLSADGFAMSALVPAGEGLFQFYRKRGYETAFNIVKTVIPAAEVPTGSHPCVLVPAALESLAELRDDFYADRTLFVRWDKDYLAYIGRECTLLGGEVLRIGCEGERGYAVCYRSKDQVFVKELAVPEAFLEDAVAALHARYRAGAYHLYLPADTLNMENKVLPFAMVRWYDREKQERFSAAKGRAPWIAHVLD